MKLKMTSYRPCKHCDGNGKTGRYLTTDDGKKEYIISICPKCNGLGYTDKQQVVLEETV